VHLDGRVLVEEGAGFARARRALGIAGMIAVTLVLDGKGRAAADPAILIEGIPEPVHAAVRTAVEEALSRHNPKRTDDDDLKESVRRAARRAASDAWGKKPVTRVEIVRL
jgi:ribonuclease J